jgi:phosphatidate cytidylyltransferase
LLTRTVVGLTALAVVLAITWIGGVWFFIVALAAILVGGYEFYTMLAKGGYAPATWLGLAWLALIAATGFVPDRLSLLSVLTLGFFAAIIYALFVPNQPVHTLASTSFVAVYLGLMMAQGIALRLLPQGFWWLLLAFAVTWINDSAAYFTGVTLGRHRMWPRLSPKKTWEGTIGGWAGAALAGALLAWLLPLGLAAWEGALIGLLGGMLGLAGDLSISMVKRQVGVKDSGRFFPGHGGMLDRLDSMSFVIPFVYQAAILLTG